MNRIYQGRVSSAELTDEKTSKPLTPQPEGWNGETAMWEHHALFQDAVNYYVVCLLALAGKDSPLWPIREKLNAFDEQKNPDERMVWQPFRRRGAIRSGMRDSVAPYLCPSKAEATPEDCFAAVLAGNESAQTEEGRSRLDAGLLQLLGKCTGAAGCKQAAPVFLPRFAKPAYRGSYGEDATTLQRENAGARIPFVLHDAANSAGSAALDEVGVHSIALPNEKKPTFAGKEAVEKLRGMVDEWRKRQAGAANDWARLDAAIGKLPENFEIPGYAATSAKNEVKFRLFAMFLFRYVERSEFTLGLLRATTPKPAANAVPPAAMSATAGGGDPIRAARGARGYVFRAFTSLPCWGGDYSGTPQWIEFDFAAFEEALKALHQVDAKAEERRKAQQKKQAQHDYQRGKSKKWKAAGEDSAPPSLLIGDPRIARLEWLLSSDKDAGGLAEEYEMSEGVSVKYGLHPRTIRGFRDLRKKWNETAKEAPFSADLKAKLEDELRAYQKENPNIVGSVRLFGALLEQDNWLIWRELTADEQRAWRKAAKLPDDVEFAKDPLQALTDERELLGDIERLSGPIRFTPAHPEHSRRQFYFSDVTALDKKGRLRHDRQTLTTEVAVNSGSASQPKWERKWVQITFTAPRLLRDQLNNSGGAEAAWQQAMMAALGLKTGLLKSGKPASFANCAAVALMPEVRPDGSKRILLNFPLTLDGENIAAQVGKAAHWDTLQFGSADGESYWLRWPGTWIDEKKERKKTPPAPWWRGNAPFRVLSVDLGQRDAGAFALLEASPGAQPKPQSRKLGEAEGLAWWATLRAMGMFRLPGEDAKVRRERTKLDEKDDDTLEELSGSRGRMATAEEWREARDICEALGLVADKVLGVESWRYAFPKMNDRLLYALRRAQARLARLQSWSCVAWEETDESRKVSLEKRRARIKEQIGETIKARTEEAAKPEQEREQDRPERGRWLDEAKADVDADRWDCVAQRIVGEVKRERDLIQKQLVIIADRIQPLRERRWEWAQRPNDSKNYFLRQTERGSDDRKKMLAGQRGLSLARIEQLESLRQRCQSLNRALQQTPGEPARLGRSKRGIELPDPCPELLERLEALKEQRVNQTAHLILAQALGVRLRAHTKDAATRAAQDIHGEYERIPRREPVDFIVLENLDRYLASQGRSRSENSRLMKWSHRAILGKLKQLCEPYGLRVLETPAAYSSKFCSLTGCAGFRAVELTPDDAENFRWRKHLERLADPVRAAKLSKDEKAESEAVKALVDRLRDLNKDLIAERDKARAAGRHFRPKWRTLLAPQQLGPIFVPASETEKIQRKNRKTGKMEEVLVFKEVNGRRPAVVQADINAAINIGLRAIASPEADDIHTRIRAKSDGKTFEVRAENSREKARWKSGTPQLAIEDESSRKKLLADARVNFFFDCGRIATFGKAALTGSAAPVASGYGLWGTINQRDWKRCEEINLARIQKAERDATSSH